MDDNGTLEQTLLYIERYMTSRSALTPHGTAHVPRADFALGMTTSPSPARKQVEIY